jgi:hypothetical protein
MVLIKNHEVRSGALVSKGVCDFSSPEVNFILHVLKIRYFWNSFSKISDIIGTRIRKYPNQTYLLPGLSVAR